MMSSFLSMEWMSYDVIHFVDVTYHIVCMSVILCVHLQNSHVCIRKLSAEEGSTFSRMTSLTTQVGWKLSLSVFHVEFPAANAWFCLSYLYVTVVLIMQWILLSEVPVCSRFIWFCLTLMWWYHMQRGLNIFGVQRQEMVLQFYNFNAFWCRGRRSLSAA